MLPPNAPTLLNDDGSASMATALMTSHHAFRRDIALFANALARLSRSDQSKATALQGEWKHYHLALHGHHEVEDERIFPSLKGQHPSLAKVIEGLVSDHHRMDPLLEQGERAFAELAGKVDKAAAVVSELSALLDTHLATEEGHVVPFLREAKAFPPIATDAEAETYAQGFAWSLHGIAPEVVERVCAMLPEIVTSRLPAARAEFEARCERVWGSAKTGASRTPIPDWLTGG